MVAPHDAPGANSRPIPLLDISRQNDPLRREIEAAIGQILDTGAFVHGPTCRQLEEALAQYCGTTEAIGCASGSDALLLSLMALEIGPGDEVLLPSFTFFATASAVWRVGAKPVFVDIDRESFNLDPDDIQRKLTSRSRGIIPVHLFGQCARMDAINALAQQHGLAVIEDAAQAIGAVYQGRSAGSLGELGCFSFYPTKNLGGLGDGGMITTSDAGLADCLRALRDHGQRPRYQHHVVGVNSRLDTIQAAALLVKLPHLDRWASERRRNARRYCQLLSGNSRLAEHLELPTTIANCEHVWNQFTLRVKNGRRDQLRDALAARKVGTAVYYPVPLHLQECFASLGGQPGSLPETERACEEVLSLPIFPGLAEGEQLAVVDAIADFFANQTRADRGSHAAA